MEIEYSNEVKGEIHAYRFEEWEKKLIAKALTTEAKKLMHRILSIDNDPKNEGQVRFQVQKDSLYRELNIINDIISEFLKFEKQK